MPQYDVLVAGELNPDLILADPELEVGFGQRETLVQSAEMTIGSSSAIFACGLARLGLNVAFIGVIGEDIFGGFMVDALRDRGVDMSAVLIDPALKTGFSVILSRGADRAILTHAGAINALESEMISGDLLGKARHLHIASYFLQTKLQPGLPQLFKQAKKRGLSTSLDTNWDPGGTWSGLERVFPHTDVFFPNENEALAITGAGSTAEAVDDLAKGVPWVAVKCGEAGAIAQHGKEIVRADALQVQVADTIGAGDSFDAGFIYGFLNKWELESSLRLAIACGSLSVRAHGGTAAQPDLEEALKYSQ